MPGDRFTHEFVDLHGGPLERHPLPYFNPHAIRSTLAMLGETTCESPEQFKAWSQNLGHDQMLSTLTDYGHMREILEDCRIR